MFAGGLGFCATHSLFCTLWGTRGIFAAKLAGWLLGSKEKKVEILGTQAVLKVSRNWHLGPSPAQLNLAHRRHCCRGGEPVRRVKEGSRTWYTPLARFSGDS